MNNLFILNPESNPNYLATICKIGETYPIEGADRLVSTMVNGSSIVVSKDMKEGDIVVYVPVESQLSEKFLSANNLYEIGEWERNANAPEVKELFQKENELRLNGNKDEADELHNKIKSMAGYFNNKSRVRIIKLRGCVSDGFIAGVDSLVKYNPELANCNWEELVGTTFSHVGDDEFCKKFIPPIKETNVQHTGQKKLKKRMRRLNKFDKLVRGQFMFHYDTNKLDATNIKHLLQPTDTVTLTVKVHGTSGIFGTLLVKKPSEHNAEYYKNKVKDIFNIKYLNITNHCKNILKNTYISTKTKPTIEYGNIYSSRGVIKNRYINNGKKYDYYGCDIWGCVNRDFSPYIPNGITVYGEIVGYLENSSSMVQKRHDYGCKVGQWKFMPYRITETDKDGNSVEWNIADVDAWTRKLVKEHPELEEKVLYLNILYHGVASELYPDIPVDDNWHTNFLERLHNDKNFYMEMREPMCHLYEKEALEAKALLDNAIEKNEPKKTISKLTKEYENWENMRAPREGVVIRIDNDVKPEAFKVKTLLHQFMEAKQHDDGEVDIEEIS